MKTETSSPHRPTNYRKMRAFARRSIRLAGEKQGHGTTRQKRAASRNWRSMVATLREVGFDPAIGE